MSYKIEVKELNPQPMVSVRTKCRVAEIGPVLKKILLEAFHYLDKRGVKASGPPFTRYHSYDGTNCEIEAGFPVAEAQQGEGRIEAGELPGGAVASTVHVGPYEMLPDAHDAIDAWMSENGKKSRGPQWERYLTDPGGEPDPWKRETELLWPID
jgi:effector-binding domain-containing protein